MLQHGCSFTGLLYPTSGFTPAVRCEECWELICIATCPNRFAAMSVLNMFMHLSSSQHACMHFRHAAADRVNADVTTAAGNPGVTQQYTTHTCLHNGVIDTSGIAPHLVCHKHFCMRCIAVRTCLVSCHTDTLSLQIFQGTWDIKH